MANAKSRRHYRVAKREVMQAPTKGVFVPKEKKGKIIALGILLIVAAYLKGMIIGHLITKKF